ncbi:MAG: DUF805 domain-containing protein [Rhodobacteraceae bacterium]|jgi:uncharacterized membrane protein YhaH (DUF805 family)|nr:DUF805 domain-containing protein [Paracoccaceae bacterium]
MEFGQAIRSGLSNYVTFSGRARRSEYWWFYLFTVLVNFAGGVLDATTGGAGLINLAVFLGLFLPTIAMSVRRLHDMDRSGWWLLIIVVPLIGILLLLYWFVTRGTQGPNRFGPDPLGGGGAGGGWTAGTPRTDTGRYAASSVPQVGRKP